MLNIGTIHFTPHAYELVQRAPFEVAHAIARHKRGDWGDVDDDDKAANDAAVCAANGGGMLSVYYIDGIKIYIDTVGYGTDEVYTVVMLPEEY